MKILFANVPADSRFYPLTGIAIQLKSNGHTAGVHGGKPEITTWVAYFGIDLRTEKPAATKVKAVERVLNSTAYQTMYASYRSNSRGTRATPGLAMPSSTCRTKKTQHHSLFIKPTIKFK